MTIAQDNTTPLKTGIWIETDKALERQITNIGGNYYTVDTDIDINNIFPLSLDNVVSSNNRQFTLKLKPVDINLLLESKSTDIKTGDSIIGILMTDSNDVNYQRIDWKVNNSTVFSWVYYKPLSISNQKLKQVVSDIKLVSDELNGMLQILSIKEKNNLLTSYFQKVSKGEGTADYYKPLNTIIHPTSSSTADDEISIPNINFAANSILLPKNVDVNMSANVDTTDSTNIYNSIAAKITYNESMVEYVEDISNDIKNALN